MRNFNNRKLSVQAREMYRFDIFPARRHIICLTPLQNRPDLNFNDRKELPMLYKHVKRLGNLRWGLGAMLLGLPLPFVILAFLFGGCR